MARLGSSARASEPDLAPRDVGELARMPRELRRRGRLRRPAKVRVRFRVG